MGILQYFTMKNKRGIMRKLKKLIVIALGMVLLLGCYAQAEETEQMKMMEVISDTQVYEKPGNVGDEARILTDLKAGTPVIVLDTSDTVWYEISVNHQTGYILAGNLKPYGDVEVLDKEFEQIAQENEMEFYTLMAELEHRRQAWIWGSIIAVLVIAIFAIGIISAVKNAKEDKKD